MAATERQFVLEGRPTAQLIADQLREQIVRHYAPQIQEYYRRNRVTNGHSTDAEKNGELF